MKMQNALEPSKKLNDRTTKIFEAPPYSTTDGQSYVKAEELTENDKKKILKVIGKSSGFKKSHRSKRMFYDQVLSK